MSTEIFSKLNFLLGTQPSGIVLSSSWLSDNGYSYDLQKRYKKSQWFGSIGIGALIRAGEHVDYLGGIYALQSQLGLSIHPGGRTALSLLGKGQYLNLSEGRVQLFGAKNEHLPLWFRKHSWGTNIDCKFSSFLPPDMGMSELKHKEFTVKVSGPARAILECLFLAPKSQPLYEVFELMEGLNNLRPATVQKLLEACNSIKVKRLFLYLGNKAGHDWLRYLDMDKFDLGTGKRAIVKNGIYVPRYQITVPKELEAMA